MIPVPFFRPTIDGEAVRRVTDTLHSGWLTTGPQAAEFERLFAERTGAEHGVAVNSATAALHLALAALGIGPGDEVLVPTMTFTATAEVVVHLGARPILVDCTPATLNIDPVAVENAIGRSTRAIMPVHYGGQACDMDAILTLADGHSLAVIEDAAHAFTGTYRGKPIGSIGTATCFSFYANKTITTGEGGMVTSNDAELIDRIRLLSLHGMSKDAWGRFLPGGTWDYSVTAAGYKYNMSDIAAALGIAQLARADEFRRHRQEVAERYLERFQDVPAIDPLHVTDPEAHAWHLFVIRLGLENLSITRNEFISQLNARGIATSVHYRPLHMHPYYREAFAYTDADFPEATRAFEEIISLPIFPGMTDEEIDAVAGTVATVAAEHRR